MHRFLKRLEGRLSLALASDTAFIETAFREILGRNPDLDGLNHYRRVLREGMGRTAVLLDIMRSEEFRSRLTPPASVLPDLRAIRPDRYRETRDGTNGQVISVFDAGSPADFDWLENAIITHGYYEKPGVWVLGVDADKRVVAEIVASFGPRRALELGCAAGAVLECLESRGILAEGIEISSMARERAPAPLRGRIHHGDLLDLSLTGGYDVVFGLDVFEHLNPDRLDGYLARLALISSDDAFVFCNIPVFGDDPVFGTVFPFYIDGWERDALEGRPFSAIHVDECGFPIHGHLTWADARVVDRDSKRRDSVAISDIERALHAKYDGYMEKRSPARRSFFVFAKILSGSRHQAVLDRITNDPSTAID